MQPSPQTRQSPRVAGFEESKSLGGLCSNHTTGTDPASMVLDRARIPKLLRHHAGYVDAILVMICTGESISIAGRKALQYTADRLREFAEVLNAR